MNEGCGQINSVQGAEMALSLTAQGHVTGSLTLLIMESGQNGGRQLLKLWARITLYCFRYIHAVTKTWQMY